MNLNNAYHLLRNREGDEWKKAAFLVAVLLCCGYVNDLPPWSTIPLVALCFVDCYDPEQFQKYISHNNFSKPLNVILCTYSA